MNLEIGLNQTAAEKEAIVQPLSRAVGQNLAAIMQMSGISSISLGQGNTVNGATFKLEGATTFSNIPADMMAYVDSFSFGIAKCMESFGIMKLSLTCESNDEMTSLRDTWESVCKAGHTISVPVQKPDKDCGCVGGSCKCGKGQSDVKAASPADEQPAGSQDANSDEETSVQRVPLLVTPRL